MKKKMVTSTSVTKTKTYGIYDPKTGEGMLPEQQQQQPQNVPVRPHTRHQPSKKPSLADTLMRKKKRNPLQNAEQTVDALERK